MAVIRALYRSLAENEKMTLEESVMAVIRASRPSFRNDHDKVAFAIHAAFVGTGFSVMAVGRGALEDNPPIEGEQVGIEGWNEMDDAYGFVFLISENGSKRAILVKCLPLAEYLMVDIVELIMEQKEPFHLKLDIKDYLIEDVGQQTSYVEMYKNLHGLVKCLDLGFWKKLEPRQQPLQIHPNEQGAERMEEHGIRRRSIFWISDDIS